MHQIESVTKVIHLLSGQDEFEASAQGSAPSSGTSPIPTNSGFTQVNTKNTYRIDKKSAQRGRIKQQAIPALESEVFPKTEAAKHANVALHSRSKFKSSIPFDIEQIKPTDLLPDGDLSSEKVFHEKSGLHYEISADSVPVFKLTKSQVPDPILFYESVRELGTRYGCIKLLFVDSTGVSQYNRKQSYNKFGANPDQFWFRATTQCTDSLEARNEQAIKFYKDLLEYSERQCHEGEGHTFSKVPSINKRTLDLFRLWECVRLRGGYEAVCQEKLWAQIGRELGYSGRIMSSLSTSLRLAYAKVLLDYEKYHANTDRDSPTKGSPLPNSWLANAEQRKIKGIYKVGHSSREQKVLRDLKSLKGFKRDFDAVTDVREGITEKTSETLPGYEFDFWQSGLETYDADSKITQSSPIYNLRQYYEKSEKHFEKLQSEHPDMFEDQTSERRTIKQSLFEKQFFTGLSSAQAPRSMDTGHALTSSLHNFGSSFIPSDKKRTSMFCDLWDLENIPLQEHSLLHHLELDLRNYTRTTVDVGMLFSVQGWCLNGNFLPAINYNHLGSSKLWQIIPSEDIPKFEELICEINTEWELDNKQAASFDHSNKTFEASELYKCYAKSTSQNRVNQNFRKYSKYLGDCTSICPTKCLPGDLQLNPRLLKDRGIKVLTVTQECGSYVFSFPKTYTSTIASGFVVSENALFAPTSWLEHTLDGARWFYENGMLPGVLPFQFLLSVSSSHEAISVRQATTKILHQLIKIELSNRTKIRSILGDKNYVENKFDYISDLSLVPTGGSKVVITDQFRSMSVSAEEFLTLLIKKEEDEIEIFDQKIGQANSLNIQLHVYCSDEKLLNIIENGDRHENINEYVCQDLDAATYDELKDMLSDFSKGKRASLDTLERLASKTDINNSDLYIFKNLLYEARDLQKDCAVFLSNLSDQNAYGLNFGEALKLVEPPLGSDGLDLKQFGCLLDRITKSYVEFPSMFGVLKKSESVEEFQRKSNRALQSRDFADLEDAYLSGRSLNIKSDSLAPLVYYMCQIKWLEKYDKFFDAANDRSSSTYTVEDLYCFLNYGVKYCEVDHLSKLKIVKEKLVKFQEVIKSINRLFNVMQSQNALAMKEVTNILLLAREENLPVDPSFVCTLESIVNGVSQAKMKLAPLQQIIDVNEPFLNKVVELIKEESIESFQYLRKFDGFENDKRIPMSNVLNQKFFSDKVKACKNWINKVNKIFTKSKREKFKTQISRVLDVELDVYDLGIKSSSAAKQEIYCFCRQGDVEGTMIECEICKEWYHTSCISSGDWKLSQDPNDVFVCSMCSHHDSSTRENLVEYSTIQSLVIESVKLKLLPERQMQHDLIEIFESLVMFKRSMLRDLFTYGDQINTAVTLDHIKHYLRKLAKSQCEFHPWVGILKAHCQPQNLRMLENLESQNLTILTGPTTADSLPLNTSDMRESTKNEESINEVP